MTEAMFPELAERNAGVATLTTSNGTASIIPVKVFPPWVWP